jgi:Flp pilus assembly protein TadD
MALVTHRQSSRHPLGGTAGLLGLAACLMAGGCSHLPGGPDALTLDGAKAEAKAPPFKEGTPQTQNELQKATDYWGKQYSANPRDLKPALNFARNLKAMGEKQRALAVLQQVAIFHGESGELASEYGRLALDLGQVNLAEKLLRIADDPSNPDWRVVSARGTVLAKQGKYAEAIPYYERALSLAHGQPSILSNLALATAMSGNPARAEALLRQAEAADGASPKIRQNLALVLGLQGKYDESKLIAARDLPMDTVAENTSNIRNVVKLAPKSMPADEGVAVAEVPPVTQPKPGKSTQVADAKSAAEAKIAAAKMKNPGPVQPAKADTAAEPATPAAPWMTDLKQAAASPQLLPWVTDLKQEPVPAPTQASFAANQVTHKEVDLSLKAPAKADPAPGKTADKAMVIPAAKPADTTTSWSANVSAKPRPKADAPEMGGEVAHRDVDLSLRAPSAKQPEKTAAAPEWTPQVASPAAH